MTAVPFDTLKFAERLEAGGFTHQQARSAAEAFADATSQELATKADIVALGSALRADLAETKADLLKSIMSMVLAAVTVNTAVVFGAMFGLAKLLGH